MPSLQNLLSLLPLSLSLIPAAPAPAPALALALGVPRGPSSSVPTIGSAETYTGQITYYSTGGGRGACGTTLSDSGPTCAVAMSLYDRYTRNGNPNDNELCGRRIEVTGPSGARATVTVADRCTGCSATDVDLTPSTFEQLVPGGLGVGRTSASWRWAS